MLHGEVLRTALARTVSEMVKSVLIADGNAFVRQRLRELLSREPGFAVYAEAENGRKAVEEAQQSHPDLILMNGLDAARALKRLMPKVPIVMFSIHSDPFTEKEARSAGVSVLVSKFDDMSALVRIASNLVYASAA